MPSFHAIPRPERHPYLGHLPEWLGKGSAMKILDTLLHYGETCGGVARIPLGPARLVLVSDPEPIRDLLTAESANVKGWPYVLTRVVLDNVLLLNGSAWAEARGVYRRALRPANPVGACEAVLPGALATLRPGDTVDIGDWVSALCADLVVELLCGQRWDPRLEPDRERVQYELAAVGIDMQCQPWAYLSPARWVAMRRSVGAVRAFFRQHVEARLSAPEDTREDVLSGFMKVADAGDHSRDASALTEALLNFFFATHDVLTASTMWCLWLLAQHPEEQARIRAGEKDALTCAVRESLRLYPGYPLFARRTQAEVTVGGYQIPGGTDTMVSPYVTHRLARHWPEPERFDPSRWRDRLEPVGPGPRGNYMPFGGGFRSCIGFGVAMPLLEQIVGRVTDHARLEKVPGHTPDVVYWGSTFSANGLPVRVV